MSNQKSNGISWTDTTWNPIVGCSKVSAGCASCWAEGQARPHYHKEFPQGWDGKVLMFPDRLEQPLHWRKPRKIAVGLMGDLFHENVSDYRIDQVFAVMALCPQHMFQVLTKRPERMKKYIRRYGDRYNGVNDAAWELKGNKEFALYPTQRHGMVPDRQWPPINVLLGVSVENQATADERIPLLLQTPAVVRFVSCEPLLGPIDLEKIPLPDGYSQWAGITGVAQPLTEKDTEPDDYRYFQRKALKINWCIVGGESGHNARPMHPDWVRSLRDQCQAAGIPLHFKQWGEWQPVSIDGRYGKCNFEKKKMEWVCGDGEVSKYESSDPYSDNWPVLRSGKKTAGRLLDGREWLEFPESRK